jgi:hypothetical protein
MKRGIILLAAAIFCGLAALAQSHDAGIFLGDVAPHIATTDTGGSQIFRYSNPITRDTGIAKRVITHYL